jgi:hypothetical protein
MELECKLTNAEMRDAFRMNLTWRFWLQTLRHSIWVVLFFIALVAGLLADAAQHKHPDWTNEAIGFGFEAFLVLLYLWKVERQIKKMAKLMNAQCERMSVDAHGIGTSTALGATTFSPWPQYRRWKEGRLVFTVGDAKSFRTIPKRAMSEMQVAEVRGILQSQIR